jgi:hypothetical protein
VLVSIILSETLNVLVLLHHPVFQTWSMWRRALSVVFIPAVPAVVLYQESIYSQKLAESLLALETLEKETGKSIALQQREEAKMAHARKTLFSLNSLRSEFRANENVFEHFVQLSVLILILLVDITSTGTVESLGKIFLDKNMGFVAFSGILSVFSLVRGHSFYLRAKKCDHMSLSSRAIAALYFLLGIAVRLFHVILFFTPILGILDVLQHGKMGAILPTFRTTNATFDVTNNTVVVTLADAWNPLKYTQIYDFLVMQRLLVIVIPIIVLFIHIPTGMYLQYNFLPKTTPIIKRMLNSNYSLIWDGIHQIVSRFLERFHYMCPLLFSCVFPS